jgi:hypothetical protein
MVQSQQELVNAIKNDKVIKKEITDTLMELDIMPSTGTQAYLNDLLIDIYNRICNKEDNIEIEALAETTPEKFIEFIDDNFTTYSAKLFKRSIR